MMTFFTTAQSSSHPLIHRLFPPTAHGRRSQRKTRRLLAACCAGIAMLCVLECVTATTTTQPVLIAGQDIARGELISEQNTSLAEVPDHPALQNALHDFSQIYQGLAQLDIQKGDILLSSMIGAQPTIPTGYTVIDIPLGKQQQSIPIGTAIELASTVGCSDTDTDTELAHDDALLQICTLSIHALVMSNPHEDSTNETALTSVAMPAEDALRTLQAQDQGPIIAVQSQ